MSQSLVKSLLLSTPLLLTPLLAAGQSISSYSVGSSQLCSLDNDGQVSCVISPGFERLRAPANLPALTQLTAGDTHVCGITFDGQPVCWGDNLFGQLDVPMVDLPLVQIDAGDNHTCAIDTAGEAICWGLNTNLQLEPPEGSLFTQVDAAGNASCGLQESGGITCWTNDTDRSPPDLIGSFLEFDFQAINSICGLTEEGSIVCSNERGITPPNNGPYTDIASTFEAVCGLRLDGALDCTFRNADAASKFPLGERFVSIQSDATDRFSAQVSSAASGSVLTLFGTTMCGERLDGSLDCWSEGGNFPDLDGMTMNAGLIESMEFDLDARIYDQNSVEIFWTPLPSGPSGLTDEIDPEVEIFRNGELLQRVRARFSFFDRNPLTEATYQIRLVDAAGNVGALSSALSVNTLDRTVLFEGEPTLTPSDFVNTVDVFSDTQTVGLFFGVIVSWNVFPEFLDSIDGYEIILNGTSAGFTRSQLFVDTETTQTGRCVEIIAIGLDGSRLDTRAIGSGCN